MNLLISNIYYNSGHLIYEELVLVWILLDFYSVFLALFPCRVPLWWAPIVSCGFANLMVALGEAAAALGVAALRTILSLSYEE